MMSETRETMPTGWTRRRFLKTAGIAAGAVAVAGSTTPVLRTLGADFEAGQVAGTGEQIFNGCCRPNCFGACQLNVHVRDGRVVKTSMKPFPDPTKNRICLRGLSHPYRIYDPERVKYPMRRAGERGEGKWERVSWDEAISEIADKFTAIREEFGPQALATWVIYGSYGAIVAGFYSRLFNALNASSISACVDLASTVGINRVFGWAGLWCSNEASDLVNAKNIFVWGNNITDAQLQEWHYVADAIEAGANLIVIDPNFTVLAGKADKWVPIRPGSDAALILSMMNVIIAEDLINVPFMQKSTVAPFLVREDTGMFLRMSDLGVAPIVIGVDEGTGLDRTLDSAAVLDEAGAIASAAVATAPMISGTYDFNGVLCRTAYDLLKDEVAKYPPETAEKLCEVPAATIVELSHLAADGPVTHRVGWGPQAYDNGVHPHHAGATLAALVGQLGFPGASYGAADINWWGGFNDGLAYAGGIPTSQAVSILALPEVLKTGKYLGADYPIKAAFVYQGNPITTVVDTNKLLNDVIPNLDFIVTADSAFTDTVRYSDIVLPIAQWFEFEDVCGFGQSNYMIHNEKAIDPPYECKTDMEITRLLADRMGFGALFDFTDSEWLQMYIDTEASAAVGITYEALKKEKCMRWAAQDPIIRWQGGSFYTASTRAEFYVEAPTARQFEGQEIDVDRERLPRFFPPSEAWPENPLYEKYPLVMMSRRSRFRVHGQWFGTKWLRELDPEPTVRISPVDAEARGIKSGDHVECYNDRGHAVALASVNNATRPGVLVYPKSWQRHQHLAGSWSELASSSYDPVAVNQSFMDNLCEIRIWNGGE